MIRETLVRQDILDILGVEMAFVVEQGVGGFEQGVISPLSRGDKSRADVEGERFLGRG